MENLAKKGTITINIKGQQGDKPYAISKTIQLNSNKNDSLPRIWARETIFHLNSKMIQPEFRNEQTSIIDTIRNLGLKYRLMTKYTSFIAIDNASNVDTDGRHHQNVAVPLPEGVTSMALSKGRRKPAKVET